VIGKININGHIGESYVDAKGQMHKGTALLDVIEQVESLPVETTVLEISVNSPGGYADVGDSIYEYLVSLKKKGKTLTTIQTGLVGSIATKIFLAGDRRIVDDRYQFWIHNPYVADVTGDQDQLREMAKGLEDTEKNLRKFYAEFTSITDEGLDGLMKIETGLTADQCIKFKFATEKKLVPAFNLVKPKIKMEDKSLKDQLLALLGVKPEKKGIAPKAQIPGNAEAKSLVVNLADGAGSFWVEGEAVAVGAACFLLDADGQPTAEPLADGDYPLEDGSMVSVMGGKISALQPAQDKVAAVAANADVVYTKDAVDAIVKEEVEKALLPFKADVESTKAEILALKKGVKLGVQPKAPVFGLNGEAKKEFKTITQIQVERNESRNKSKVK
jgi:ATP-dependent protease ClpP protease subunit